MFKDIPRIWNDIPWQERRTQIINLLCQEEYGFLPPAPVKLEWEPLGTDNDFCAGKAPLQNLALRLTLENKSCYSFPVNVMLPAGKENIPFFVYISFFPEIPDRFLPCEEIIDNGFGILSFYYEDVTANDNDFDSGLAGKLGMKNNSACGKIALWAWAAQRVMDYAESLPQLDKTRTAVVGHSRLGKTALLAGACDTRFNYVFSNNSGCCGAAISRGKKGESINNITEVFPYWFKESFKRYAKQEDSLPFDQHFLLAASAPRNVYVSSAQDDSWADPQAEALSCELAAEVWKKLQEHNGRVGYHERKGSHYLSREDWQHFMRFMSEK